MEIICFAKLVVRQEISNRGKEASPLLHLIDLALVNLNPPTWPTKDRVLLKCINIILSCDSGLLKSNDKNRVESFDHVIMFLLKFRWELCCNFVRLNSRRFHCKHSIVYLFHCVASSKGAYDISQC